MGPAQGRIEEIFVAGSKNAEGGAGLDPMHQFEVHPIVELPQIGGVDVSFTNASLWMALAVGSISLLMIAASRPTNLVPGRLQLLGEMAYSFVANMIKENIGTEGMKFFPFIFTLFMFILFCNMLGMLPYSYTVTSHLIVTFALAATVFMLVTLVGFFRHGIGFLKLFVPSGIPVVLLPLLVVIEVISYLTRPVSLSVRLFGNMMAGHTMLKIFGGFVVGLGSAGLVPLAIAPFALMVAFTGLELLIAGLQAYVFTILTCIYLNEAIHMDH
jgi:F-type H+-transporting ATPase subunit a